MSKKHAPKTERRPSPRPAYGATATGAEPPVVGFVSLGCVKNLVDSEKMLALIAESGAIIGDESLADTIVVNTCGFLGSSRQEALDVIRELAARKRRGQLRRLVVAGCLVQRDGEQLRALVPEIDALVGVHNRDDVAQAVWPRCRDHAAPHLYLGDYHPQPWSDRGRLRLTPRHYAYVRISEGCDQKCTFCTIPTIRGPLHCKPPAQLVDECRELSADGARELILIGQDTTSYGADTGGDTDLAGLLRTLDAACDGVRWIRLMYAYPSAFTDAALDALADCPRVVKYVDLPLQHINDLMLKAMGRRVTRAATETLLNQLRRRIPGVTIRTTFIVGFPGETETEFAELLEFVRAFGFDAVGAFPYSLEPETPAGRLPGHVDEAVKVERYERLMSAQQEGAFAAARRRIDARFEVVVDEVLGDGRAVARHAGQAPEVDAVCRLSDGSCQAGELVPVRCVGVDGYDLVVRPLRQPLPVARNGLKQAE